MITWDGGCPRTTGTGTDTKQPKQTQTAPLGQGASSHWLLQQPLWTQLVACEATPLPCHPRVTFCRGTDKTPQSGPALLPAPIAAVGQCEEMLAAAGAQAESRAGASDAAACLLCLSPPASADRARPVKHRPLPGLCLMLLPTVTPPGLMVDSEAGNLPDLWDLPGCRISWPVGPHTRVSAMGFGLCFCCGTSLVFGEGVPRQKAVSAPLTAASTRGTHGLEEVARGGLREATRLLEDVWALFVLAAVQSSTFPACPLCCCGNFPLNLSVFSPQSFW